MRFEIYKSLVYWNEDMRAGDYEWFWRLRARNGRIVVYGAEGYATKAGVRKAISRITDPRNIIAAPVVEVEA